MKDTEKEKQVPVSKFVTIKGQKFKLIKDNTANCITREMALTDLRTRLRSIKTNYELNAVSTSWIEGKDMEAELISYADVEDLDREQNPDLANLLGHIGQVAIQPCGPMGIPDEDAEPSMMDINSMITALIELNAPSLHADALFEVQESMLKLRKDFEKFVSISFVIKETY